MTRNVAARKIDQGKKTWSKPNIAEFVPNPSQLRDILAQNGITTLPSDSVELLLARARDHARKK